MGSIKNMKMFRVQEIFFQESRKKTTAFEQKFRKLNMFKFFLLWIKIYPWAEHKG